MSRFRAILVWLLFLAIPLQGAAATTMIACGPNHAARIGHATESSAPNPHKIASQHSHLDSTTTHHHHAPVTDSINAQGAEPVSPLLAKGKCSVCASCCSGSIITTQTDVFAFEKFVATQFPVFASAFADAPLHRFKRPPRA